MGMCAKISAALLLGVVVCGCAVGAVDRRAFNSIEGDAAVADDAIIETDATPAQDNDAGVDAEPGDRRDAAIPLDIGPAIDSAREVPDGGVNSVDAGNDANGSVDAHSSNDASAFNDASPATDAIPPDTSAEADASPLPDAEVDSGSTDPCGGCGSGRTCCDGVCVATSSDDSHCGSCGNRCFTGHEECRFGRCEFIDRR